MEIKLKQRIKESVLEKMREAGVDLNEVDTVILSADEISRGRKEGSVDDYYKWGDYIGGWTALGITSEPFLGIRMNEKVVIPVEES